YWFSLNRGKYVVCEVLQAMWTQCRPWGNTMGSGGATAVQPALAAAGFAVTITSGSTEPNNNFGNFQQGTKSGVKFNDMNANGAKIGRASCRVRGWDTGADAAIKGNRGRDNGETTSGEITQSD